LESLSFSAHSQERRFSPMAIPAEPLTVVVAHENAELQRILVDNLRQFNVLEANDVTSLVEILLTQTRRLDVLLADTSPDKQRWIARLHQRRPKMLVWYVKHLDEADALGVTPEVAVMNVRELSKKNE